MLVMFIIGFSLIIIGFFIQIYAILKNDDKEFNEWLKNFENIKNNLNEDLIIKGK